MANIASYSNAQDGKEIASLVTKEIVRLMSQVLKEDLKALLSILAIMCVGGGYKAQLKLVDFGVAKELNEIAQSIDLLNNADADSLQLAIIWLECGIALLSTDTNLRREISDENPLFMRQNMRVASELIARLKPNSRSISRVYGVLLPKLVRDVFGEILSEDCGPLLLADEDRKSFFETILLPLIARSYSNALRALCYRTTGQIITAMDVVHSNFVAIACRAMQGISNAVAEAAAE
ncbi:hypothetical protein Pmar_PMAR013150 [Perkinsus marinus ATCC 50983]|uniref:Uncharacterized protein n=1 Tax=Perkinsus marinus (strain ATCC 50983 / TXsc) TaxID=423536 RepID=C5L513_PERM5|nr:hypothetical protein Pmar_PMAR013150 [Perkinsus marinus ATCC 50983]EER08233.1 hypothetical protein Pmar_PMAR013150 [Perkinsus marinus ATCC 50983]|eukprot:XP_002776417.1 hypothetical protein Pmar_PMAR013150 [Perkinsus marinus ATCC 50983]